MSSLSYLSLFKKSLPAVAAVAMEPVAELIDTAILGQVNTAWVAALAATTAFLGSFAWIFNFLSHGVTAQLAQAIGRGEKKHVGELIKSTLLLALFLGLVLTLFLMLLRSTLLFDVLGADQELAQTASVYWDIRVLAFPLVILSLSLIGIFRGLQQIPLTMKIVACMTLINALGTYFSVLVFDYGVAGAAWSTVLSFVFAVSFSLFWLFRHRKEYALDFTLPRSVKVLSSYGKDAIYIFGRSGCLTISFFVATALATRLGSLDLATHQIALQVWLFVSYFIDGFAINATSLGGRFIGQKDYASHRTLSIRLLNLAFITGLVFTAIYVVIENSIIGFFTKDKELVAGVAQLWFVLAFSQIFNALLYVYDGILFGMHEFRYLYKRMFEATFFVFLPLVLLGFFFIKSLFGLWLALIGLNFYRFLSGAFQVHRNFRRLSS